MQQLSWCLAVASREDTERSAWTEMGDSWFGWVGQMPQKKHASTPNGNCHRSEGRIMDFEL